MNLKNKSQLTRENDIISSIYPVETSNDLDGSSRLNLREPHI